MPGTYTSRGNFYKPAADGSDNVNVVTDLNQNWDRLDALLSWRPVTSSTMPASAYQGAAFYQTDTGKGYLNTSSGASAVFVQVPVAGADFDSGMTFNGSVVASGSFFRSYRALATSGSYASRLTADADDRYLVLADGKTLWGDGAVAGDTNLYRSAADTLTTDDSFTVGGNLTVAGSSTLDDVIVGGNFLVGGARFTPQAHVATTVANTTTETALQTVVVLANSAAVGATYQIRMFGTMAVTGTPSMTFKAKLGGVGGQTIVSMNAITARSGMTDGYWDIELILTNVTLGSSGTWTGMLKLTHNFITGVGTYTTVGPIVIASLTRDTTTDQSLVISAQWSAASSSNTITARGSVSGRMA